jgi:PAS domain S-box-containing protein/diguanylate cyclase (GGDEF)-like protein
MMSLSNQKRSSDPGSFSRQSAVSPLRYGVVTIIVLTLGYAFFRIIPMLHRDLQLLDAVYAMDEQGISLEGDLQYEVQESRSKFLRILLARARPAEEIRSMRACDAAIAVTEAKIAALQTLPLPNREQFHTSWLHYIALRDKMLSSTIAGDANYARGIDPDLGKGAFEPVEVAARDAAAAFRASSATHIREVSRTLNTTLMELAFLTAIKILVLFLLLWSDWKRLRAERQLRQTTRDLRATEDKLRLAYESSAVGMGIIAMDGTFVSANRVAAKIMGYEPGELIGRRVRELVAPGFQDMHLQQLRSLAEGERSSYQGERQYIRKDGSAVWVRNNVNLMQAEGEEQQCFFTIEEITLQKEANDRLAYLANFDPVTNLPNRHSFEERLAAALKSSEGGADCVALLYLEIDSFDFVKGTFGRSAADEVLNDLGSRLTAFQKTDEIVGRLDDHGFGLLVRAAPYDEATMLRAAELRDVFRQAGELGKYRIPLSASIGIAYSDNERAPSGNLRRGLTGNEAGGGAETLVKYARAAMMEARSRGGDSIYVADPSLQERAAQRHRIESALLRGLREDEFQVVFQPQFEIATGRLVRFEALCRWTSAELGPISPDTFIPIAEQTGLIMEIGRRVMQDALRQAKSWTDTGRRIGLAVNISPMQFMRPDFLNVITEALALSNFPPALLELEITEGIFIRDLNLAITRIRELQRLGLTIALDDFGTGYSSLSYLQRMPIDAVKLDRSFVKELTTDVATVSMVRSVLAMADALHLRVVTEGVETEQQLEILRALGCDEAQGYLLGRPESAELALQRVIDSPVLRIGTLA